MEDLISLPPYSLSQAEKETRLLKELNTLTEHHRQHCQAYNRLMKIIHPNLKDASKLNEVPYLPIGLFKTERLLSIPESDIFRVLTSSGTAGKLVSQVFLDRPTADRQTKALVKIMTSILGPDRMPMVILDSEEVLAHGDQLNARYAAILGMMNFGRDHFWALDENRQLKIKALKDFLHKHSGKPILLYGFTFMVWRYFIQCLSNGELNLPQGVLIHVGGWKKLHEEQVTNEQFKQLLKTRAGLQRVHNFYGMVEQTGSVFLEGPDGFLYPPAFADVIVRNPVTWQECPVGETGVIQVLSALPTSYPGHSLLTEDLGVVHGIDDSQCGWLGKRFSVVGRVPKVELRGCSDVYAYQGRQ